MLGKASRVPAAASTGLRGACRYRRQSPATPPGGTPARPAPPCTPARLLVISDTENFRVRVVATHSGTFYGQAMTAGDIYTVAGDGTTGFSGDGGPATKAGLSSPGHVAVDQHGNLIIPDSGDNRVRVVPATSGTFYVPCRTAAAGARPGDRAGSRLAWPAGRRSSVVPRLLPGSGAWSSVGPWLSFWRRRGPLAAAELAAEELNDPEIRREQERTALAHAVAMRVIGSRVEHQLSQTALAHMACISQQSPGLHSAESAPHRRST